VPAEFFETIVAESLKVPARVWKAALEPYLTVDFSRRLKEISAPTLLIWGDRDAFTLQAEQDALNRAIAGSRLMTYSGTGHAPHWEEPERYAADLIAFVSGVGAPPRESATLHVSTPH
jgi:pimeloyl-ACP methyl ester carboxylesterase